MGEPTDTELWDWVQAQTTGYGKGWIFRMSVTGRGCRLHETSQDGAVPDVRAAVRAAMKESQDA